VGVQDNLPSAFSMEVKGKYEEDLVCIGIGSQGRMKN
jgi:20S proteasome alpha/beta subunit